MAFKMKGFPMVEGSALHKDKKTYAEKLGKKLGVKTKKTKKTYTTTKKIRRFI